MLQTFTWQISEILRSLGALAVHLWLKNSEESLEIILFKKFFRFNNYFLSS